MVTPSCRACLRRYYQRVEKDTPYLRQRFVVYKEVSQGRVGDAYDASEVQVMQTPRSVAACGTSMSNMALRLRSAVPHLSRAPY